MAVTRIKNNQITDSTITYAKIAPGTLVGSLFNENLTLNSNISIIGNLSVTGTSSSVSSTNTYVNDPLVVFNNGYTGSLTGYDIGILVNRNLASLAGYSGGVNTAWIWSEADSAFVALVTTDTGGGITGLNNSGFANIKLGNLTAINATLSGSLTAQSFTAATFNGNVVATNIYTTNFSTGNAMITGGTVSGISGAATTLYVQNFSTGNAQITGGYTTGLSEVQTTNFSTGNALITGGTARLSEIQVTNFSSGNILVTGGTVSAVSGQASTLVVTNFSSGNARISGGYADNFPIGANTAATGAFTTLSATGDLTIGGDSTFDGNLIPNLDSTFNIGSSAKRWKDIWLSGSTIYLGSASISTDSNGNLVVATGNGNQFSISNVSPNSSTFTSNVVSPYFLGNLVGTSATVGTVTATTGAVTNISGTGLGYTTGVFTNFSTGNAQITGGFADNFPIGANTAASGKFTAVTDTALTSGRVVIASTGGLLADDADLTFSGTTLSATDISSSGTVQTNNLTSTSFAATTGVITNFSSGNAQITGGSIGGLSTLDVTTLHATNFSSGNVLVTGGKTVGLTEVQTTNFSSGNILVTGGTVSGISGSATTLVVTNFSSGNARITGGYTTGLSEVQTTNFSTGNAVITGGSINGITTFSATTGVVTNFSTGNAVITGGYADNFPVGANTAAPGKFTTLSASGVTTITNGTAATGLSTGALQVQGGASIDGNLWVGGNIYAVNIYGATQNTIVIQDPLIYLQALGNLSTYDYDIGFYSDYTQGGYRHTGLARSYATNTWNFFSNVYSEPDTAGINWNDIGLAYDNVKAGQLILANATVSTSTSTGALQVTGGAGIQGALYAGQIFAGAINNTPIGNTTPSTGRFSSVYTTDFSSGNAVITGGSVNGTAIGATSASTGKFTAVTDTALTSGRVTFATTGGELADSSALTFNSGTSTLNATHLTGTDLVTTGDVTVGTLTSGRVTFASTGGKLVDDAALTFNSGTGALGTTTLNATTVNATTGGFSTVNTNNLNATNGNVTTLYAQNFSTANAQITGGTVRATEVQTTNFSSGNILVTGGTVSGISGSASTLVVTNFSTANAQITGGTVRATEVQTTNFSSGNILVTGGTVSGISGQATTLVVTNFSTANAQITGGSVTATLTGNITAEYATITNLSTGNAVITGGTVSGISGQATTLVVTNFSTANAQITGGTVRATEVQTTNFSTGNALITGGTVRVTEVQTTNFSSGNVMITGGTISGITSMDITSLHATNFSTANAVITGGSLNSTPIGASSASSAVVTTLGATSTVYFSDTTEATTSNIGAVVLAGGLAVNKQIMVGGNLVATATTESTSTVTGSFIAKGGVGIVGNVYMGKGLTVNNAQVSGGSFVARGVNSSTLIWARSNSTYDQVLVGGSATAGTLVPGAVLQVNSTDSILLPVGTNAQRPSGAGYSDVKGMFRYSDTANAIEWYTGSAWESAGTTFTVIADEQFNGDGSQVNFTLSAASTTNGTIVSINGVLQIPTLAYSVGGVGSTTLTFTEAPAVGDVIDVRRLTTTQTVTGLSSSNGYMQVNVTDTGINLNTGSGSTAITTSWDTSGAQVSQLANVTIASSGVATTIDSFAKATYRTAKYIIQSTYGSSYQSEEMLVIHDGSTATVVTGTPARTGGSLGTPSATISGSNVLVQFNASNAGTIIRIKKDYLVI